MQLSHDKRLAVGQKISDLSSYGAKWRLNGLRMAV